MNNIYRFFAEVGINDVLGNGITTASSINAGWDKQWLDLLQSDLNSNLYGALTKLGIFFAVGTLLVFMLQWLKDVLNSEYSRPLSSLIWPLIVVMLLGNSGNGSMLSSLTLGMRNFLNTVNQQVIVTGDGDKLYQQALNMSIAEDVAGSLLRPCQSLTGEQQNQCFVKASEKINLLWQEYRNLYGNRTWIDRLETKVNQVAYNTGNISENTFNSLLGSTVQTIIKSFLVSLQYAFQNLIEVTMLLIAALGPLAVGGSLLPVAGKPIFAWLTGFIAAGISKISFNLVAILTAAVIVNGPGQDANADPDLMWFMIFLGLLAPTISLLVAASGGFAVFSAISNTATWVRDRV
jgi:hypothetical protein